MNVLVVGANGQLGCGLLPRAGRRRTFRARIGAPPVPRRGPRRRRARRGRPRAGPRPGRAALRDRGRRRHGERRRPTRRRRPGAVHRGRAPTRGRRASARRGTSRPALACQVTHVDEHIPLAAERRRLEEHVRSAVPGSVILRLPAVHGGLAGSRRILASRCGVRPIATIGRPSPFLRTFRRATGSTVENRGVMLVPGPTTHRQAFIAVRRRGGSVHGRCGLGCRGGTDDRRRRPAGAHLGRGRRHLLASAGAPGASWCRRRQSCSRRAATLLRRFAPVASRRWRSTDTWARRRRPGAPGGGGLVEPATMTTVEEFLRRKAALPAALPLVA